MIRIEHLGIQLPGFAVEDVNLHIEHGEFFALMGPTGSGKTLVIESVAGLAPPPQGRILIDGRDITALAPEDRNVCLVYQDHSLFPHLSVLQNVMYGQRYHGIDTKEGRKDALELLDLLGLSRVVSRKPAHLSGGEKQRVSIARALACKPDVILLDEPLSSLDPQFRSGFRQTLKELHQTTGITFLMVTHDFVDAHTLADRAAVIRAGKLEQSGTVEEIFRQPATPFVAEFVGMTNVLSAHYHGEHCTVAGKTFQMNQPQPYKEGFAALRPEDISISEQDDFPDGWWRMKGLIKALSCEGFIWKAQVQCGNTVLTASVDPRLAMRAGFGAGSPIILGFAPEYLHHMQR